MWKCACPRSKFFSEMIAVKSRKAWWNSIRSFELSRRYNPVDKWLTNGSFLGALETNHCKNTILSFACLFLAVFIMWQTREPLNVFDWTTLKFVVISSLVKIWYKLLALTWTCTCFLNAYRINIYRNDKCFEKALHRKIQCVLFFLVVSL